MLCVMSPAMIPPALSRDQRTPPAWGSSRAAALTVDVDCAADIGAAQGVGHLTGDRL